MVTDGNPLASQGTDSAMLVGKITPPEGLFAALRQVRNAQPMSLAVLVIFAKEIKGKIGIGNNRVITGALVEGTGEVGEAALNRLMPQMSGMYGVRGPVENESAELQQKLLIDIDRVLQAQHIDPNAPSRMETDINEVDPTYTDWLKTEKNKVFADIERSMTRTSGVQPTPAQSNSNPHLQQQAANFQQQVSQGPAPIPVPPQRAGSDSGSGKWSGLDDIPTPQAVTNERRRGQADSRPDGAPDRRQSSGQSLPPSAKISSVQQMKAAGRASGTQDITITQPISSVLRPQTSVEELDSMEVRRKMRIGIAVVGVIGACAFINMFMTNNQVNTTFNDANKHFEKGEYKETIFLLQDALLKDPNNGRLHMEKGLAHAKLGEYDDALKEYDIALAKGAARLPALLARATVFSEQKEYGKTIAECTTILLSHPDCVAAYVLQATAFDHTSQPENAEKACTTGLKYAKTPEQKARLLLERGYALARMHKPEDAEKDLSAAIEMQPTVPMYMARGDVYKKLGKYKEAIADYTAVIERDPANYNALVARAMSENYTHQEKSALADFAEALKINKGGVEAYIQRGSLYLSRHAYQLAINDFEDALRLNPQIAESEQKRDFAYKQLRMVTPKLTFTETEHVDASAGVSSKLKLPGSVPELLKVGFKYLNDGELQYAIACFRQAVKMQPQNENARKYLAHAYFEAGDSNGAAEQFEALNKISGVDDADILPFSQSLARSGRTARAVTVLESYLQQNPRATNYRCDLANLYLQMKQIPRAKATIAVGLRTPGISAADKEQLTSLWNSLNGGGAPGSSGTSLTKSQVHE